MNAIFLWVWDILNLYALAGFGLLLMRRWRTRSLVIFGAIAALYSDKFQEWWMGALGIRLIPESLYEDPAVLHRQAVAVGGDYPAIVATFWQWTWTEWIAGGLMFAWMIYALGRFALGAAIGRSGILDDIRGHLPLLRRITWIALPDRAGSRLAHPAVYRSRLLWREFGAARRIAQGGGRAAADGGLCAGIVVALHTSLGARLFGVFAPVGRMALTNYLVQGLLYGFVMTGVGPGLGSPAASAAPTCC